MREGVTASEGGDSSGRMCLPNGLHLFADKEKIKLGRQKKMAEKEAAVRDRRSSKLVGVGQTVCPSSSSVNTVVVVVSNTQEWRDWSERVQEWPSTRQLTGVQCSVAAVNSKWSRRRGETSKEKEEEKEEKRETPPFACTLLLTPTLGTTTRAAANDIHIDYMQNTLELSTGRQGQRQQSGRSAKVVLVLVAFTHFLPLSFFLFELWPQPVVGKHSAATATYLLNFPSTLCHFIHLLNFIFLIKRS